MSTDTLGYQVEQLGPIAGWEKLVFEVPGIKMQGKGFLGARLGLTGSEVSLNAMPPGKAVPFAHAHKKNEELYLFLTGKGEMLLDGKVVPVGPGTAVRVAPPIFRCWRNTGDEPLTCIVMQAKAGSLEEATAADGVGAPEPPRWP
jgi:mannose-6-phosphate isomerase-like protein (cupin superfamily)